MLHCNIRKYSDFGDLTEREGFVKGLYSKMVTRGIFNGGNSPTINNMNLLQ